MDKNRVLFFGTLVAFVGYIAITLPTLLNGGGGSADNYVIIDGKKYTEADLKKSGNGGYKSARKEYIGKLGQVFESFAQEEILKQEAEKNGQKLEDYLKTLSGPEPSEAEIKRVFEAYKEKLGGATLEQTRPQIVGFLNSQKQQEAMGKVLEAHKIDVVTEKPERQAVAEKNNPSVGPENAKITVIEFSDFECPYCQRSQEVTNKLREKYKGQIRWVFRDYPLPFHQNAMFAHIAANCANKQGKYWDYFSLLFQNTGNLTKEKVLDLARQVGLSNTDFNNCVADKDGSVVAEIQSDIQDGQEVGVNGTPAFFINGIMVEGAQPLQNFEKIIDQELKK